jgi:hypothetical protein
MSTLIDATPSGASSNSYLTREEADALMEAYPQIDKWDDLAWDAQERLLMFGTRLVDAYPATRGHGWGAPKVSGQRLAFPRENDAEGVIPKQVLEAVMELVDSQLDGRKTPILDLKSEGVASASVGGQSMSLGDENASQLPAGSRRVLDQLINAHVSPNDTVVNRGYPDYPDPGSYFG